MTLSLNKVRGSNRYEFHFTEGVKEVRWEVEGADVAVATLLDIVDTVAPAPIAPTTPAIPAGYSFPGFIQPQLPADWNRIEVTHDGGAAADKAAREEEQRLMNMGSALKRGINMGPEDIPVFDKPGDMPDVNWGV